MVRIPWLSRFVAGAARSSVLMASVVLLIPNRAVSQDTIALPAALLRRAAEVADGQRLAASVFVVLRRTFPHHVAGIFTTRAAANAFRTRVAATSPDLVVVGPVSPTIPLGPLGGFMAGGCVHNQWTTAMTPPPSGLMDSAAAIGALPGAPPGTPALINDSSLVAMPRLGYCGGEMIPPADVVSVTITTKLRDSTTRSVVYRGGMIDAAFFTVDALDKFVFPYYAKLFGAAAAANMREAVVGGTRTP